MEHGTSLDILDTAQLFVSCEPTALTARVGDNRTPAERSILVGSGEVTRRADYPGSGVAFFAPDFGLRDPRPWYVPERSTVLTLPVPPRVPVRWGAAPPRLDGETVRADIRFALQRILDGDWQKIVPVWFARRRGCLSPVDRRAVVRNAVASASPGRWAYGLTTPDDGVVGVTPEVLFRVDSQGLIYTMALAGTQQVGDTGSIADFLNDPKERAEHRWVIDYLSDRLASLGSVVCGEMTTVECGSLRHIVTPFTVRPTRRPEFNELVELLHPTPAVGAVPRESGLAWLREREERCPRGRHGAPFGAIGPNGEMVCLVAIRNLQWSSTEVAIGAGCGIVATADPEREFGEACAKVDAIQVMLGVEA